MNLYESVIKPEKYGQCIHLSQRHIYLLIKAVHHSNMYFLKFGVLSLRN